MGLENTQAPISDAIIPVLYDAKINTEINK